MPKCRVVATILGAAFIVLGGGLTLSEMPEHGPRPTTLRTLVEDAATIAELQVESQQVALAELGPEGSKLRDDFTSVTFLVREVIAGHVEGDTITLRFSGGDPGGHEGLIRIVEDGIPTTSFEDGERVILFLQQPIDGDTYNPVIGDLHGKFSIETDPATGREYIADAWGGKITGVEPETGQFMTVPGPPKKGTRRYFGRGGVGARRAEPPLPEANPGLAATHHDPLSPRDFKDLIRALRPTSAPK